jgi:hypothetical protein
VSEDKIRYLHPKACCANDSLGTPDLHSLGTTPEVSRGLIFKQDQIARAVELGLGIKSLDQIHLVTDDSESEAFAVKIKDVLLKS